MLSGTSKPGAYVLWTVSYGGIEFLRTRRSVGATWLVPEWLLFQLAEVEKSVSSRTRGTVNGCGLDENSIPVWRCCSYSLRCLQFGLALQARAMLACVAGIPAWRHQQEEIVRMIVSGRNDSVVILPTGSGKSLLYQVR